MRRAIHRIRHHHETGGALKSSADRVFLSMGSRKGHSTRRIVSLSPFSSLPIFVLTVLSVLSAFSSGCASRKPIADQRQPPPSQPTETPAKTADRANDPLTCRKLPRLGQLARLLRNEASLPLRLLLLVTQKKATLPGMACHFTDGALRTARPTTCTSSRRLTARCRSKRWFALLT